MRRTVLVAGTLLLLVACAQEPRKIASEWEGHGRIQGQLWLGDQVLERGSLEMIQLSGPVEERCGPGACGISVDSVLQGDFWPAGRWRVVPPQVPGWTPPASFMIVITVDDLTTFEARYEKASGGTDPHASPSMESDDSCTQLGPSDCYLGPSFPVYPEQWETSLEEALGKVAFPLKLPAHPAASLDDVLTTFLSPDGLIFVMIFPLPPPEQPLRMPNLEIFQSPWVGGDPEASLEEAIANDPSVNKALYTVHGVTALGNKAHSPEDQTGENPAFLRLVLDGVELQLGGGESLDLLIEIAESMN